ncbi:MAG TPA: hypothetical protein VFG86_08480, partial [Chloroflexota bacterium]|nr:hypothetical protein [Chloroflexota bacterium]
MTPRPYPLGGGGGGGPGLLAEPEYRVEGQLKVTGAARYAADARRPGTLWMAYARSPLPHARIVAVRTEAACSAAGVHAVLTGADLPAHARFGRRLQDWPVLCSDRVRFVGDRVAAVAAETREAAQEAARLIDVDYEPLPALLSPEDALADEAPPLHPQAAEYAY